MTDDAVRSRATHARDQESDLQRLLREASAAAPADRIETYRNRIAELGLPAIEALEDWIDDPDLCRFAVRTIGRAASGDVRDEAIAALKAAHGSASPSIRDDIEAELTRLGAPIKRRAGGKQSDPYNVAAIPADAGRSWPGFQAREFGNVDGTTWRRRRDPVSLPPIVLRALRDVHPHFDSWPIYRWPAVHFAITDRYRQFDAPESGWRAAKLVIYARGPVDEDREIPRRVIAGLYIEKGGGDERFGDVDARWDWPRFVTSLVEPEINERLADIMVKHGLALGDLVGRAGDVPNFIGGVGRMENGVLVFRGHGGQERFRGWEPLRHHLEQLPGDKWHNVHVWREWTDEEAVRRGPAFAADAVVPVLVDLGALYLEIIKGALADGVHARHRVTSRRTRPDGRPEIEFIGQAHANAGHFSIPRAVMDELAIPTDGRVILLVETLERERRYAGEMSIRSGEEIYFRAGDLETRGLDQVRSNEWLRVSVSSPLSAPVGG